MKISKFLAIITTGVLSLFSDSAEAQSLFDEMLVDGEVVNTDTIAPALSQAPKHKPMSASQMRALRAKRAAMRRAGTDSPLWDLLDEYGNPLDPDMFGPQAIEPDTTLYVDDLTLPGTTFLPLIFNDYSIDVAIDSISPIDPEKQAPVEMNWAQRSIYRATRTRNFVQRFMMENPGLVVYNIRTMPRPPKEFHMEADPSQAKITVTEFTRDRDEMIGMAKPLELERINWLRKFDGSLHFSQAYISPNWYQGGKSNLNAILHLLYDVKLNPAFHPNLIFETSIQYKLGVNNAPDDSIHSYNISEDLFQLNTKFGVKAAKRWYYSLTAQFKTQMVNSYKTNTNDLVSSFLSPAELNVGLGMTYNYENTRKTANFTAALSPISYNLKACTNKRIDPTLFGIDEGKRIAHQYGSSAELTFRWKIAYNIEYFSRLFLFTNYDYMQGDWENTVTFNINKFLSTKIFAHLRYQSDAKPVDDSAWNKWQLKEILSIGFTYRFGHS